MIASTSIGAPPATSIASQGREAERSAGADADQVRASGQPQASQFRRHYSPVPTRSSNEQARVHRGTWRRDRL